ncbi:MAG: hypothetical protein ABIO49_10810 [Dokdonella sp.]
MGSYLSTIVNSHLPFDAWVAAAFWCVLFLASQLVARRARAASEVLAIVVVEGRKTLSRGFQLKYVIAQIVLAGSLLLGSLLLGEPAFVFFVGGLIVAVAFTLGLNVQSLLSVAAMARANAATGQLKLSTAFSFRQMAQRLLGSAIICALLALALAHLALMGGAFFLGSTAAGYARRARQITG